MAVNAFLRILPRTIVNLSPALAPLQASAVPTTHMGDHDGIAVLLVAEP